MAKKKVTPKKRVKRKPVAPGEYNPDNVKIDMTKLAENAEELTRVQQWVRQELKENSEVAEYHD